LAFLGVTIEVAVIRIVHLSDIHFWSYPANPLDLFNKRIVGVAALALGRAGRFRLERVASLVEQVQQLDPDHLLITGDLTTTALDVEFRAARRELAGLLRPGAVSVIPGNHDRYTGESLRARRFEHYFGEFAPRSGFPWIRWLDDRTAILALDPTRPALTAHGLLPDHQIEEAKRLLEDPARRPARLLIACHYPLEAPAEYAHDLERKSLRNAAEVRDWLAGVGRHLYCCGHVHAAWAFIPADLPDQLCLNAGSPLFRDPKRRALPGFLEILLDGRDVLVKHHAWDGAGWTVNQLWNAPGFFP
jgi:3',5'-cyclic AMP phosphodiesterase CpdA